METRLRSGTKSAIWRITGVFILAIVTYAFTRNWIQSGLITFIHHAVFLVVFYSHERFWLRFPIKRYLLQSVLKMFTYETICGNVILGVITYLVTGDVKQMTYVTLTYIGIKHVVYIINEFVWKRWEWGYEHSIRTY